MKFLIDENLPRTVAAVIKKCGHDSVDVRDLELRKATDTKIAAYAQTNSLCILTSDFDFADIRTYPPEIYSGIVVLVLPENANRDFIHNLVLSFLSKTDIISLLPGRLAIVETWRVRLRPI